MGHPSTTITRDECRGEDEEVAVVLVPPTMSPARTEIVSRRGNFGRVIHVYRGSAGSFSHCSISAPSNGSIAFSNHSSVLSSVSGCKVN
mmetsp:Transcript_26650/g.56682  ORF Transcript_26650/g.56682 Transcript_26650/m.56682 type:complete len:89 (-) Transcript_26650:54-320(-)